MNRNKLASLILIMMATAAGAADLTNISYNVLSGDKLELRFTTNDAMTVPKSFTMDNPARISLDLNGVTPKLDKKSISVGVGGTRSVSVAEAGGRTRVVINLDQMVAYSTRVEGTDLIVTIGDNKNGPVATSGASVGKSLAGSTGTPYAAVAGNNAITNVDFRRGEKGEARVVFTLSNPKMGVDVRQEGRNVYADFLGANISNDLIRRLDVVDFGTPAKVVEVGRRGGNVAVKVDTVDEFEYLAYQTDNLFTLELKPLTKQEVEARKSRQPQFTGERLTLSFQDIQVRAVLQIIADFTHLNMVTSDTVSGSVTLRLQNVPWDQALDIILKTKGLDKRQTGNVMLVAPADEIAAREKLQLEAEKQVEELAPVRSEFIQVNYAKAADIAALLKSKNNTLLSDRGNVTIDDRTNTLLVLDTSRKLDEIRNLIRTLDIPVRQVLIESRIVTATDGFSRELGVKFGVTDKNSQSGISGTLDGAVATANGTPTTTPQRLNVNMPANKGNGPSIGFNLSRLTDGTILDLELSALESENKGEVIASPRVVTANQKEAHIESGVEIPYQQASSSGATAITFKKAVLGLTVKPQITPDDRIILDLTVTQDTRGEETVSGPAINTQQVGTQVLVNNGETVVLGGIYKQETTNDIQKVPLLGDIPGLGWLFRNKINKDTKQELLVFVTPKILKENTAR